MPVSRVVVPVSWLLVPVSRVVVPISRVVVPVSWLLVPVSRVVVPVPRASWLAVKASLASSPARTIPGQKCQSHHGMELHMAHAEKLTSLLGLQGDASLQGGGASLLGGGASLHGGGASLQGGVASLQGLLGGGGALLDLVPCKNNTWSAMPSHHRMELHMGHAEKLTSLLGLQGGVGLLAVGASLQGGVASILGLQGGGEGLLGLVACKGNAGSAMPSHLGMELHKGHADKLTSLQGGGASLLAVGASLQGGGASILGLQGGGEGLLGLITCKDNSGSAMPSHLGMELHMGHADKLTSLQGGGDSLLAVGASLQGGGASILGLQGGGEGLLGLVACKDNSGSAMPSHLGMELHMGHADKLTSLQGGGASLLAVGASLQGGGASILGLQGGGEGLLGLVACKGNAGSAMPSHLGMELHMGHADKLTSLQGGGASLLAVGASLQGGGASILGLQGGGEGLLGLVACKGNAGSALPSHLGMELHMGHADKLTSLQGGGASLLAVGASLQGGGASILGLQGGGEGLLGLVACKDNSGSAMPIPPWNGTAYGACRETHQSSGPPG